MPLQGCDLQFRVLSNLLDLHSTIASHHEPGSHLSFQFIFSIAVVDHYTH